MIARLALPLLGACSGAVLAIACYALIYALVGSPISYAAAISGCLIGVPAGIAAGLFMRIAS